MTERAVVLQKIDALPPQYWDEVVDFVGYLKQKNKEAIPDGDDVWNAMAADTEREREAQEWCNGYFGPVRGK